MIAACPKCAARYRIDPTRLGPQGSRLRCTRCTVVFRVKAPRQEAAEPPPTPVEPEPPQSPEPDDFSFGDADADRGAASAAQPAPVTEEPAQSLPVEPAQSLPVEPAQSLPVEPAQSLPVEASLPADPESAPEPPPDASLVLVADPDKTSCQRTARALESWGLATVSAEDGVEAILTVQRRMPEAVVMSATLPKMFGFQVCELMKRNDVLKEITVVLVGTVNNPERYRRPPTELYGADAYIETPDLPEGLLPILQRFGLLVSRDSARRSVEPEAPAGDLFTSGEEFDSEEPEPLSEEMFEPEPLPAREPVPEPPPTVDPPPSLDDGLSAPAPVATEPEPAPASETSEEIAAAERLARIIVSDIILYNEERFSSAVQEGNVLEELRSELDEGRHLFEERVDPGLRADRDFLTDELLRVARSRGMTG